MTHGTLFHTKRNLKHVISGKAISVRGNAKNVTNENVRSETASDSYYQIGYEATTNDRNLMK